MTLSRRTGFALVLWTAACSDDAAPRPSGDYAARPDGDTGPRGGGELTYFDSDAFDRQLANRLAATDNEVPVATAAPITLNEMPKRMNAWLAAVTDKGGQVVVVNTGNADPATGKPRFLGSIIASIGGSFVSSMIGYVRERRLYAPAAAYDATLVVSPATGQIEKVFFTRKGA